MLSEGDINMKFRKSVILTGKEIKERKDGSPYYMVHVLMDNGQTCTLMFKGKMEDFNKLKPMEQYVFDFEYIVSKYGQRLDVVGVADERK